MLPIGWNSSLPEENVSKGPVSEFSEPFMTGGNLQGNTNCCFQSDGFPALRVLGSQRWSAVAMTFAKSCEDNGLNSWRLSSSSRQTLNGTTLLLSF